MPAKTDLTNKIFGRLTVLEPCEHLNGRTAWLCQCECGNKIKVQTKSLSSGNTKSCGCLQKDTISKIRRRDLTNQRFGKLVAIEATEDRKHGSVIWKCLCDCGNEHFVSAEVLLAGKSTSCGCLHSKGNAKIQQILETNNYHFISEYPIRVNNINYYFDFAILNDENQIVQFIEYDGILHFEYDKNHGWNNKDNFDKTQLNDSIKNNWAKEHQIPLLRIPYTDFDKIDLQYIKERTG